MEFVIIGAWNIWKQRNRKHFDGILPTVEIWLANFIVDSDLLSCRVNSDRKDYIKTFVAGLRV
jgi:hypothetical protein